MILRKVLNTSLYLPLALTSVLVNSCFWSNTTQKLDDDFDVSFDHGLDSGVDETEYYNELEKSTGSIVFESSFPVAFFVGKKFTPMDRVPSLALAPSASTLTIQWGKNCRFKISTGPILVERYLYTGEWIKFSELKSKDHVNLQAKMDLNLGMSSQLSATIPKEFNRACWKLMYGRKTYLGKFHIYNSGADLIPGPQSPRIKFAALSRNDLEKVYIHWLKNSPSPVLKNDLDFPAVVKSSFYRTFFGLRGFYYLNFKPYLELNNSKLRVIHFPQKSPPKHPTKK